MSIHSQLTGADLHENKGVATAAAGTVATASGTGTTNWLTPNNQTFLFANCASPGSIVIPIPEACTLIRFVVGLSSSYGVTVTLTNNISGAVTISPKRYCDFRCRGSSHGNKAASSGGSFLL